MGLRNRCPTRNADSTSGVGDRQCGDIHEWGLEDNCELWTRGEILTEETIIAYRSLRLIPPSQPLLATSCRLDLSALDGRYMR